MDYNSDEMHLLYKTWGAKKARTIYYCEMRLSDNTDQYRAFTDAVTNLGIEYGGAALEYLLDIWVTTSTKYPPIPDDLLDFIKSLNGPNAYALLRAYRIRKGLEP